MDSSKLTADDDTEWTRNAMIYLVVVLAPVCAIATVASVLRHRCRTQAQKALEVHPTKQASNVAGETAGAAELPEDLRYEEDNFSPAFQVRVPMQGLQRPSSDLSRTSVTARQRSIRATIDWSLAKQDQLIGRGTLGDVFLVNVDQISSADPQEAAEVDTMIVRRKLSKTGNKLVLRTIRPNVLKLTTPSAMKSELEALRHLKPHTNVLRVLSIASDEVQHFGILMEHAPHSLAQLLRQTTTSSRAASKMHVAWPQISIEIAQGLAALHDQNVAHLSLTPNNVLLDAKMVVKISDYGRPREMVSALVDLESVPPDLVKLETSGGQNEPRQLYCAPEFILPDVQLDTSADLWSLGVIIVRVATLKPPYAHGAQVGAGAGAGAGASAGAGAGCAIDSDRATWQATLAEVGSGILQPADGLCGTRYEHSGIAAVVRECTSREPSHRPTSRWVASILSQLRSIQSSPGDFGISSPAAIILSPPAERQSNKTRAMPRHSGTPLSDGQRRQLQVLNQLLLSPPTASTSTTPKPYFKDPQAIEQRLEQSSELLSSCRSSAPQSHSRKLDLTAGNKVHEEHPSNPRENSPQFVGQTEEVATPHAAVPPAETWADPSIAAQPVTDQPGCTTSPNKDRHTELLRSADVALAKQDPMPANETDVITETRRSAEWSQPKLAEAGVAGTHEASLSPAADFRSPIEVTGARNLSNGHHTPSSHALAHRYIASDAPGANRSGDQHEGDEFFRRTAILANKPRILRSRQSPHLTPSFESDGSCSPASNTPQTIAQRTEGIKQQSEGAALDIGVSLQPKCTIPPSQWYRAPSPRSSSGTGLNLQRQVPTIRTEGEGLPARDVEQRV